MSELSARMMVTGGNVTALTTQLEQESLIERLTDEHDKRATRVRLTEEGQQRFARMAWRRSIHGNLCGQPHRRT
jgi:DNA-binding MarR family transcriptional regulator